MLFIPCFKDYILRDGLTGFIVHFRHFDKDKSGKLDHQEFKSCLRALGYDLPVVEEGEVDPEFQAILDMVDPNRYVHYTWRRSSLRL